MSLQIRRGTNQERLNFTPVEGEVIYVTDSQVFTIPVTDIASNTLTSGDETHFAVGDRIRYIGNSANGLVENTVYYVKTIPTAQSFTLSTSSGGATVTLTNGTGLNLVFATTPYDASGVPLGHSIAPIWVGDGTTVGGLPAGAATLDELADVTIGVSGLYGIALDSNQHLQYDGVTNQWRNVNDMIIPGYVNIQSTTDATSKDSGALIVEGGVGIEKALYVGTNIRVGGSTNSTSKDTGALVIQEGGLGVESAIFAGTNITAGGDVAANGGDLTTTASTFNLVSTATTVNIGASAGNVIVAGDLKINGNDIKSSDGSTAITLSGNDVSMPDKLTVANEIFMSGSQPFVTFGDSTTSPNSAENVRGIRGNVAYDDKWFVGAGAVADDQGYLLLAVGDNGTSTGLQERIIVRKTGGSGTDHSAPWDPDTPVLAELELFDENNYTTIPERLGVGITPTVKLDVNGSARFRGDSVTVDGNLIVNGTTTTINSTTLTVDDKNIELGSIATPTDTTADGGGITLKGATDKNITWTSSDGKWHISPGIVVADALLGAITIGPADGNTINTQSGDLYLNAAGGEVRAVCDFVAQGELRTNDNQITFLSAVTGSPSENVNIIVERGTSPNVALRWNESTDRWGSTTDGTNYVEFPNQALDTGNNPTFAGATLGAITVGVDTDLTLTTTAGTLSITSANSTVDLGGDVTVLGNFRTTDNIFRLNFGVETGTPTTGIAGMAVRRGDLTDANWVFDETYNWWTSRFADNSTCDIYSSGSLIAGIDLATNGRNIIFNNDDATPSSSDDMVLLVKRGTSPDVNIKWNESTDRWTFTNDGTNYVKFANQDLDTGNEPTFGALNIDTVLNVNTGTATTSSTSTATLATFDLNTWRTIKLVVQASTSTEFHSTELLIVHNGTTAYMTQYGEIYTGSAALATYSCDINSGNVRLRVVPGSNTSTAYKITTHQIAV